MSQKPLPFAFNPAPSDSQGPFNTKIEYSYHDARNFGTESSIIVAGEASLEVLKAFAGKLIDNECFLPLQLGMDSLTPDEDSDEYNREVDHPMHKFEAFSLTEEAPTVLLTFEQLVNTFNGLEDDSAWNWMKFA